MMVVPYKWIHKEEGSVFCWWPPKDYKNSEIQAAINRSDDANEDTWRSLIAVVVYPRKADYSKYAVRDNHVYTEKVARWFLFIGISITEPRAKCDEKLKQVLKDGSSGIDSEVTEPPKKSKPGLFSLY